MSLQVTPAQSQPTATAWEIPSANHPDEPGQITELSDTIQFYFKPLSFGVVCYVAIDNQNTERSIYFPKNSEVLEPEYKKFQNKTSINGE